jgi:hypothetical protein
MKVWQSSASDTNGFQSLWRCSALCAEFHPRIHEAFSAWISTLCNPGPKVEEGSIVEGKKVDELILRVDLKFSFTSCLRIDARTWSGVNIVMPNDKGSFVFLTGSELETTNKTS